MPLASAGGLHLTALLFEGDATRDLEVAARARTQGVAVIPLSYHYLGNGAKAGCLLGYGAIATPRIDEGLGRLGRCL